MENVVNTASITAIFLDVGNTLRILLKEEPHRAAARNEIVKLLGVEADPDVFCAELDRRYKVYRKWAFDEMIEASEKELWTRWLLPDFPKEQITSLSPDLTFQFRQSMGRRVVAEGGKETIIELYNRGYKMGLISNVITEREIPDWLESDGLAQYFSSVVLSSVFGRRKPHPSIYDEAVKRAGVKSAECVYVGDNFKRDVEGTRAAGFGMVVILPDPEDADEEISESQKPDLIIHKLSDLLNYFPGPQK